jgi:L-aspartate oxidase
VSRAIVHESARTGQPVFLSLQHLDSTWVHDRFPTVAEVCRGVGLDLARDRIPVAPAAHYVMGGVVTDVHGRSSVAGLLAAGEVACTGVHGANRLASNSLLEGLVFGARAGASMLATPAPGTFAGPMLLDGSRRHVAAPAPTPSADAAEVQGLMWDAVGVVRDRDGLDRAAALLAGWERSVGQQRPSGQIEDGSYRTADLTTVAALIARASLRREESRGAHYRSDFPARDDVHWQVHIGERRGS